MEARLPVLPPCARAAPALSRSHVPALLPHVHCPGSVHLFPLVFATDTDFLQVFDHEHFELYCRWIEARKLSFSNRLEQNTFLRAKAFLIFLTIALPSHDRISFGQGASRTAKMSESDGALRRVGRRKDANRTAQRGESDGALRRVGRRNDASRTQ